MYYTSSDQLCDDITELVLKSGKASTVGRAGGGHSEDPVWVVRETDNLESHPQLHLPEWIDYDGKVYCAEVPNHLL